MCGLDGRRDEAGDLRATEAAATAPVAREAVNRRMSATPNSGSSERRSYSEGFSFAVLSILVFSVIGIVTTYVTARVFGVTVVGEFALSFAPTGAVWVLSTVREQPAMVRRLANLRPRAPEVTGIVAAVFAFSFGLTAVVSVIAAVITWFVFHGPVYHPELFGPAVAQLAGYTLITNTGMNLDSVFAAFRSGRQLFWVRLHGTAGTLVATAIAGIVWGTVWAYTIATILPLATALVHRLIAVRGWMTLTTTREELRRGFDALPEIVRFGLKMAPGYVADGVAAQSGTWLLGAQSTTAAVGAYSRAWSLGTRLLTLTNFVGEMTLPTLVERKANDDHRGFEVALVDSLRYVMASMLLPAAVIGGAAVSVMQLMGAGFGQGAGALAFVMLLPPLMTSSEVQGMALVSHNRPLMNSALTGIRMVVVIVVTLLLIPPLGITAPALALCVGAALEVGTKFVITSNWVHTPMRELWPLRQQVGVVLAYVAGFASARGIDSAITAPLLAIAVALAIGSAAYLAVLLLVGGVGPRDRERFAAVVAKLREMRGRATVAPAGGAG
jgi:O-antigen/teichoic acid export membrane protein